MTASTWAAWRAAAERHRVERDHIGDPVVLDEDVLRPARRRAVAVYYRGVMNQQPVVPFS
jgi:hypothetical protein